jgi:hypothetical protein
MDNVKLGPRQTDFENRRRMELSQDSVQWEASVLLKLKYQVPLPEC